MTTVPACSSGSANAITSGPALRRLPTPRCEPPYDDDPGEREGGAASPAARAVQGTLALSFVLPSGLPVTPQPPRLRLVPSAATTQDRYRSGTAGTSAHVAAEQAGHRRAGRAVLPDPRPWAGRFVQAVLEVLSGDRPVTQLVRWTDADVFADVQRRVTLGARRCPPGRTGHQRAVVRSVRVSEPADGVAEVCALIQRGVRLRAVALRLDGVDGRWQCTALELG